MVEYNVNCIIIMSLLSSSPGEPGKFIVVGGVVSLQSDVDGPGSMTVTRQQLPWGCGISLHHFNIFSVAYFNEITISVLIVQHNIWLSKMSSAKKIWFDTRLVQTKINLLLSC